VQRTIFVLFLGFWDSRKNSKKNAIMTVIAFIDMTQGIVVWMMSIVFVKEIRPYLTLISTSNYDDDLIFF
jgi:hypothetical protein